MRLACQKRSLEPIALACIYFAATSSDAFQFLRPTSRQLLMSPSSLAVSTPWAPQAGQEKNPCDDDDDNDDEDEFDDNFDSKDYRGSGTFRRYLKSMRRNIRAKTTLANRMDDELKRVEIAFYDLKGNNAPKCRYSVSAHSYDGPSCEPDMSCYAMVATAYAKAGLGRIGAELAHNVYERYEKNSLSGIAPNAIFKTACLNAWCQADDWGKIDGWLQRMEDEYVATNHEADAPDCVTYTSVIEGLANSRKLKGYEIVSRSQELLQKTKDLAGSGENPWARPNRYTYISVMKCQLRTGDGMEMMDRVESLYRQMEEDYKIFQTPDLKPKAVASISLFNAAARCRGGTKAAMRAEELLSEFQQRYEETGDPDYRPVEGMYVALMTAYAKVDVNSAKHGGDRAEVLLAEIEKYGDKPSTLAITAAINAIINHKTEESAIKAERLLRTLQFPDSIAYQCVIKAYSRVGNPEKADELIQELNVIASKAPKGGNHMFRADVMTVAAVINGYAKFRKVDEKALERSEELLEIIIDAYREGKVRHYERNVESWVFEDVIRLWSTSKRPDAGEHIMELIDTMESLNKYIPDLFEPSQAAYILLLDAWALTGRKDAGKYAMEVIKKMEVLVEQGKLAEITIRALSSALTSVTKAGGRGAVKSSETLLRRIIRQYKKGDRSASVNARTLTNVLSTMVRGAESNADERAIQLLREMTALSQDGIAELAPNTIVYNCVLNGLAKRGLAEESLGLLEEMKLHRSEGLPCPPDIVSYSCVCRAIAASRTPFAVEKLEGILAEVVRVYKQGEDSLKPDAYLFNAIIGGFAKVSKRDPAAAGKADELLKRMEMSMLGSDPIAPDLVSFSSVCQAYAMSNALDSAANAADVLDRSEKLAANGLLAKPDTGCYSSVVLAHTKSVEQGSMDKAVAVVEKMEFLYKGGRLNVRPNARIFNLLLAGYANSRDPDKVSKVRGLFAKLNKMYEDGHKDCEPDVNAYNWIMLTAARASTESLTLNREKFDLALKNFKLLHELDSDSTQPNSYTYDFFLKACRNLLPDSETRKTLSEKAFKLCQQRGLVTAEICVETYRLSPSFVLSVLDTSGKSSETASAVIPESWCVNVPSRRRERRVDFPTLY